MDSGWIKAHRAMLDHPLLQRADEIGLWMRLLLMAAHRPQRTRLRGQIIALERGQAAVVMTDLVEPDGMSRKRLRLIVESWVKDGMLTISHAKGQACSIVTICNFDTYQSSEEREGPSPDGQNLTGQSGAKVGPSSVAKMGQAKGQASASITDCNTTASGCNGEAEGQAMGQGRAKLHGDLGPTEQEDKKDTGSSLGSQAKAHSDPSDRAAEPPPKDAKSHLWREMKAAIKGCDPSVTDPGALVGKWIVHAGGGKRGEGAVFAAHLEAMTHEPAHYLTWMHRQFNGKATKRGPPSSADLEAEALRILNESESSTDDPEPADPGGPDAAARRYEASGHLH